MSKYHVKNSSGDPTVDVYVGWLEPSFYYEVWQAGQLKAADLDIPTVDELERVTAEIIVWADEPGVRALLRRLSPSLVN